MIRYRLLISGRVQGVFFRDTCRRVAQQHGVSGWVRNLPDGRVEAVFEGPAADVGRLVEWSREGPEHRRGGGRPRAGRAARGAQRVRGRVTAAAGQLAVCDGRDGRSAHSFWMTGSVAEAAVTFRDHVTVEMILTDEASG